MILRRGVDEMGIAAILNDSPQMEDFLRMGAHLTREELKGLVDPLTTDAPPIPADQNDIQTIMMATYD